MERGRGGKGEREGWEDHMPYSPPLASASNTTLGGGILWQPPAQLIILVLVLTIWSCLHRWVMAIIGRIYYKQDKMNQFYINGD